MPPQHSFERAGFLLSSNHLNAAYPQLSCSILGERLPQSRQVIPIRPMNMRQGMNTSRQQQAHNINETKTNKLSTASTAPLDRASSLQVISHVQVKQAHPLATPLRTSTNIIYSETSPKKRKFEGTDVKKEGISGREYDCEVWDVYDEDEEYKAISNKRKRTVGVPKAMGPKVSHLVQDYENQVQQTKTGYQRARTLSKSKLVSGTSDRDTNINCASAELASVPASFQQSMPKATIPRVQSPLVIVHRSGPSFSYPERNSRYDFTPTQPDIDFTGKPRYWACHRCGTNMIPYIFNAHMNDQLKCSNAHCVHACCAKCAVGSAGEVCEQKEWHEHKMGYWGWVQSKGITTTDEINEKRQGGRGRGRYIRKKG